MLSSKSHASFKNVKVMDAHVYKMHTGDNGSTRKDNCRSCSRGAKNHCWPENRKIKIPSKPRYPRFLKRIANKSKQSPKSLRKSLDKSLETASSINPIIGLESTTTPTMQYTSHVKGTNSRKKSAQSTANKTSERPKSKSIRRIKISRNDTATPHITNITTRTPSGSRLKIKSPKKSRPISAQQIKVKKIR